MKKRFVEVPLSKDKTSYFEVDITGTILGDINEITGKVDRFFEKRYGGLKSSIIFDV